MRAFTEDSISWPSMYIYNIKTLPTDVGNPNNFAPLYMSEQKTAGLEALEAARRLEMMSRSGSQEEETLQAAAILMDAHDHDARQGDIKRGEEQTGNTRAPGQAKWKDTKASPSAVRAPWI